MAKSSVTIWEVGATYSITFAWSHEHKFYYIFINLEVVNGVHGHIYLRLIDIYKLLRASIAAVVNIMPFYHIKSLLYYFTTSFYNISFYQMFYIFTTSFKYYILILILSFLYNLFHGNISILFQISMVTFQTKLLILFFFFGRNRPACLGFKQYCYFFYFFFIF